MAESLSNMAEWLCNHVTGIFQLRCINRTTRYSQCTPAPLFLHQPLLSSLIPDPAPEARRRAATGQRCIQSIPRLCARPQERPQSLSAHRQRKSNRILANEGEEQPGSCTERKRALYQGMAPTVPKSTFQRIGLQLPLTMRKHSLTRAMFQTQSDRYPKKVAETRGCRSFT